MTDHGDHRLVLGYGNPGRLDDGLGPALAEALAELDLPQVTVVSCYQLAIEHAELAARHDVVIFADAAVSGPEPFQFARIEPKSEATFSTHSVAPAAVLGLARDIFGATPEGYLLGIRGYEFDDFGERLSRGAGANLSAAAEFCQALLTGGVACEV